MGLAWNGCYRDAPYSSVVLRPGAWIGEIHVMDSLLSYESSSSNSDSERGSGSEPRSKIVAIGEAPVFSVHEESDNRESKEERGRDNMAIPASEDSDAAPHGGGTFGPEGFHPTDTDQPDESDLREGNSKLEPEDSRDGENMSVAAACQTKRNPYALKLCDLNPGTRSFLATVKTYFTQKVNLERQKAALCPSTLDKAQE